MQRLAFVSGQNLNWTAIPGCVCHIPLQHLLTQTEAASTCFPANVHAVSRLFQQQGHLSTLRAL